MCRKVWKFMRIKKKIYFFRRIFFFKRWKINFWEWKCDFCNNFFNFNLFYWYLVNFLQISFIWTFRTSGIVHWMKVKKIYFFRRVFFSSCEKLTFEKENVIFLILFQILIHFKKINFWERKCDFFNTFWNVNLIYWFVVNFL